MPSVASAVRDVPQWGDCEGGLGQERSGLNYSDTLIRALGKVVFCMCGCVKCLWICTVTMHHRGRSQGLCVCVSVCGLFSTWKPARQRDRRIKGIRRQDWERLIKAHATISLMSSLTPSAEVNSSFPNPLLVLSASVTRHVICSVYQCPWSHRLHLAEARSGNLQLVALWHQL